MEKAKAQQKYRSNDFLANKVSIHATPDCCFERIDHLNVVARESSLHHLQQLDYLVEGKLCGNTGTSRINTTAVVRCQSIVIGIGTLCSKLLKVSFWTLEKWT